MSAVGSSYTLIGTCDTRLKLKVKGERSRSSSGGVLLLLLLLVLAAGASQASGRSCQPRGGRKGYGEMGGKEGSKEGWERERGGEEKAE